MTRQPRPVREAEPGTFSVHEPGSGAASTGEPSTHPSSTAGQTPFPVADGPDAGDSERERMERTARYLKGPTAFSA